MTNSVIMKRIILIFQSTHGAIKAERLCMEAGVACRTIPVPRHISSDCGIALEIGEADKERMGRILQENAIVGEFRSPRETK